MTPRGLVLLDRDGVLNALVIDPEHGTIDSPLHPGQVTLLPGVPQALRQLCEAGFGVCIVTNQPAYAKGKTTWDNLQATQHHVREACQSDGGRILDAYLCPHRAEDACPCRKPRPGLLQQALAAHPSWAAAGCWMVGDGVTDIEAGHAVAAKTVFVGPRKCDACKIFRERDVAPHVWASGLPEAAERMIEHG